MPAPATGVSGGDSGGARAAPPEWTRAPDRGSPATHDARIHLLGPERARTDQGARVRAAGTLAQRNPRDPHARVPAAGRAPLPRAHLAGRRSPGAATARRNRGP